MTTNTDTDLVIGVNYKRVISGDERFRRSRLPCGGSVQLNLFLDRS